MSIVDVHIYSFLLLSLLVNHQSLCRRRRRRRHCLL